jgi:hypothetical protein
MANFSDGVGVTTLLLLGAGFSRNWGGWLATEAFEHLLGSPEVIRDAELRRLLWKHQNGGGFEAALAELQAQLNQNDIGCRSSLMALQDAVKRMFVDMNTAFLSATDWQFGQRDIKRQIGTFLTRFDAIFTLNQDVLLEHHYANDNVALIGAKKWAGVELPGMSPIWPQDPLHSKSWSRATWTPLAEAEFTADARFQPIYKLHGSSNWIRADGHYDQPLLIMGGAKVREIGETPILNWYARVFEERLTTGKARLMVIGYGFRDDHINAAIARGVEKELKLYIVAPEGAELARKLNRTRSTSQIAVNSKEEEMIEESLIGASRRNLGEIFGHDDAEFSKVMRFFD